MVCIITRLSHLARTTTYYLLLTTYYLLLTTYYLLLTTYYLLLTTYDVFPEMLLQPQFNRALMTAEFLTESFEIGAVLKQ